MKTIVNAGLNVVDFPPVPQDGQDGAPLHVHRLQCELATLGQRNALLETLIDALRLGVVLADREGRLQYRNRAAQEILARRDGLCDRDDILLARSPAAARALAQALTAIATGACDSEALSVPRDDGEPYALLLTQQHGPLPKNRDHDTIDVITGPWNFLANANQSQRAAPLVLVLIRDSRPDAVGNFAAIGRHFALTASEITLLEALTCGERLNDFCHRRGISPNTGKFHLRSLFAKTGTHRQADLVRRTVSLLASFAPFGG